MTLRRQLAWRYAAVAAVCLALLAGLVHHEFLTEPRQRKALGIPELPESQWGEYVEVFFYGMIPFVLAGGWWIMYRTVAPLKTLSAAVERIQANDFGTPLPRLTYVDEVEQLVVSLESMRKRLHEWSQHMRQFTLHASHELKTPLTVMGIQFENMLREHKNLSADQIEWLECQLDEVQRLGKIVDNLTLLTKADVGLLKLESQPVKLSELMRESYEDAKFLAEANLVRVMLRECAEVELLGDRHRLRQLLLNLVDNAIKYNWLGGMVTLALRQVDGKAELEVSNSGAGLRPEMQERVFERFVRGDEARSRAVDGSGLGLSICKWIVEAHRGTIQLSSQPGISTKVLVQLPVASNSGARTAGDKHLAGKEQSRLASS